MMARDLLPAGLYLLPTLLFAEIAREQWEFRHHHRPKSRAFHLLPIVTTVLALHYLLLTARSLMPERIRDPLAMIRTPWHVIFEDPWLLALALLRHLLHLLPLPEQRPSRLWLLGNYGLGVGFAVASGFLRLRPGATALDQELAHHVFEAGFTVLGGLCAIQFVRRARPGRWRPEYAGELRRPDVVLVQTLAAAAFLAFPVIWAAGGQELALAGFEVLLGLAVAAPMAARMLGRVIPETIVTGGLFAGTIAIFAVYGELVSRVDRSYGLLVGFSAVVATVVLFILGQHGLRELGNRLIRRRHEREMQELQRFLHTLSPELGAMECCRRVLAELVHTRRVPGASMLFSDGTHLVEGALEVEPLLRAWPQGTANAALPPGAYGTSQLRDLPLPLRDAIIDAEVSLGIAAIDSPRRRWGHLFLRTGFLGGVFREDDVEAFVGFVDQLALLLDTADLLARTVAAERSLAQAEKLATIGELAARFAHDIRNPVTAARSLAQQLARDPTAPENAAHAGIILEELERVERQVRDLLRFSRREEYQLAPVDLGRLVERALVRLGPRLDAARVVAACTAQPDVVIPGDRDKLDHVLVNLIENAIDAMADSVERRLRVAVERANGTARLRLTDTGSGAPSEVLENLFEPFYSRKAQGTGLGLAIVKRTIEGHGGRIAVVQRAGEGLTFTIELPFAPEPS